MALYEKRNRGGGGGEYRYWVTTRPRTPAQLFGTLLLVSAVALFGLSISSGPIFTSPTSMTAVSRKALCQTGPISYYGDGPIEVVVKKERRRAALQKSPTRWFMPGYSHGLRGGLGNQIFEVLSALGIAKKLRRQLVYDLNDHYVVGRLNELGEQFPQLWQQIRFDRLENSGERRPSTTVQLVGGCCRLQNLSGLERASHMPVIRSDTYYMQSFYFFDELKDEIRHWLGAATDWELAQVRAMTRPSILEDDQFRVCVHTRRGDFVGQPSLLPSTIPFTQASIRAVVEFYQGNGVDNVSVIVFGDSLDFKYAVLNGFETGANLATFALETNRKLSWLFASRFCDAVVITASGSTFAWWMAYLHAERGDGGGGDGANFSQLPTVFYNEIPQKPDTPREWTIEPDEFFPLDWQVLREVHNPDDPSQSRVVILSRTEWRRSLSAELNLTDIPV